MENFLLFSVRVLEGMIDATIGIKRKCGWYRTGNDDDPFCHFGADYWGTEEDEMEMHDRKY
jgi:hypothetical protein